MYAPCEAAAVAVAAEAPGIARAGDEKDGPGAAGAGCVLRFFPTTRGNWGESEAGEPGDEEDVDGRVGGRGHDHARFVEEVHAVRSQTHPMR